MLADAMDLDSSMDRAHSASAAVPGHAHRHECLEAGNMCLPHLCRLYLIPLVDDVLVFSLCLCCVGDAASPSITSASPASLSAAATAAVAPAAAPAAAASKKRKVAVDQ